MNTQPHQPQHIPELPQPDRTPAKPLKVVRSHDAKFNTIAAAADRQAGIIYVGRLFHSMPRAWQQFVIGHEQGHALYSDERHADHYGYILLLKARFAGMAALNCLQDTLTPSPEKTARIAYMRALIEQTKF